MENKESNSRRSLKPNRETRSTSHERNYFFSNSNTKIIMENLNLEGELHSEQDDNRDDILLNDISKIKDDLVSEPVTPMDGDDDRIAALATYIHTARKVNKIYIGELAEKAELPLEVVSFLELGYYDIEEIEEYKHIWIPSIAYGLTAGSDVINAALVEKDMLLILEPILPSEKKNPITSEYDLVIKWVREHNVWNDKVSVLVEWLRNQEKLGNDVGRAIVLLASIELDKTSQFDMHYIEKEIKKRKVVEHERTISNIHNPELDPYRVVNSWIKGYGEFSRSLILILNRNERSGKLIGEVLYEWSREALIPQLKKANTRSHSGFFRLKKKVVHQSLKHRILSKIKKYHTVGKLLISFIFPLFY